MSYNTENRTTACEFMSQLTPLGHGMRLRLASPNKQPSLGRPAWNIIEQHSFVLIKFVHHDDHKPDIHAFLPATTTGYRLPPHIKQWAQFGPDDHLIALAYIEAVYQHYQTLRGKIR